jgi:hypothetical protein
MGGIQDPLVQVFLVGLEKMRAKAPAELPPEGGDFRFELEINPFVQFSIVSGVSFYPVENRGFQIGQDEALEEFKKSAFDNLNPVEIFLALFEFSQDISDDHFMGLLVQLDQLDRANLVIPALHAGGFENFFDQGPGDHILKVKSPKSGKPSYLIFILPGRGGGIAGARADTGFSRFSGPRGESRRGGADIPG